MHDLLRSQWDEPRPAHAPLRVWRDWALVAVLPLVIVLEAVLRPDLPSRVVWAIVLAGLVPTLLWRRTRPLLMLAIAFIVGGLVPLFTGIQQPEMYSMIYFLLLPYSLVRWGSGREVVLGSTILILNSGLWAVLNRTSLADVVGGFAVLTSVMTLGAALRYRARERTRELDQVKLLERERLARDLHDTVAHHVSAMAIRAQAGLATMASQPEAAADALRVIEAEASRALVEMRTMVRLLRRDQPAELSPSPQISDLEGLASRSSPGPSVEVEISGDVADLHPSVGTAIYRLAQESVTNALRHARHATRIEVRVAADDTSVHLRVNDDGDGGPAASPGYGLVGMMERADLLGGTCEAGPNPGRGWTVTAVLPRNGLAA